MSEHRGHARCQWTHVALSPILFRGRVWIVWYCPQTKATWKLPLGTLPLGYRKGTR